MSTTRVERSRSRLWTFAPIGWLLVGLFALAGPELLISDEFHEPIGWGLAGIALVALGPVVLGCVGYAWLTSRRSAEPRSASAESRLARTIAWVASTLPLVAAVLWWGYDALLPHVVRFGARALGLW